VLQSKKPRLSPDWIDSRAYKIVETLRRRGHNSYLVGGCVRDLLLGIIPKDYDIATTALPPEVKRSLPNSYIIGRRFRLVLVKRDDLQFEVATFRRDIREDDNLEDLPPGDNLWGTPEEDAKRRDFTINALFYDPVSDELIDYANGLEDLREGLIKIIGDPDKRIQEDPIRILRAIRLAHKIRFSIDRDLKLAIVENAHTLSHSALPRKREELLKFLRLPEPLLPILDSYDLGVMKHLSPTIHKILENPEQKYEFVRYLQNYHDYFIDKEKPVELFSMLCLAVYRSLYLQSQSISRKSEDILEDPIMKIFMRDELGMFNYEQSSFAKALHMQSLLQKNESFKNKGERRKMAVLSNEIFPLAFAISRRDHHLTPDQIAFWQQEYWLSWPKLQEFMSTQSTSSHIKKRRKKFRRKGPPKPSYKSNPSS
jgi:poly(A) polymerase